jgi:DNA modification methylase
MIANKILLGDNIETLKTLPDNTVDCCITSPPYYGLRDYGTAQWEGGDPNCDHKIPNVECDPRRTGGDNRCSHVFRFNRTKCHKCGAVRIDQQIGLEETPEKYIEKIVDVFREVRRVLREDGTLWVNIGDSYAHPTKGNGGTNSFQTSNIGSLYGTRKVGMGECKPKDLMGIPWMLAFSLRADGWYLRSDIVWYKPNVMPESVTDRCTKSHEYIFLLSKNEKYYYDYESIKEQAVTTPMIRDKYSEGYQADYVKGNRFSPGARIYGMDNMRNKRDVWIVNTKPHSYAHFAIYPEKLITPCVLAGSREGGIVLDPFMGSGTTAIVALKLLRKYIGCEINPEYIKIAEQRIANERCLFNE